MSDDLQDLQEIDVLRIQVAVLRDRAAVEAEQSSLAIATQAALATRYKDLYEREQAERFRAETELRRASLPTATPTVYTDPTATPQEDDDE